MSRPSAFLAIAFVQFCQTVMTREAVGECTGKYKGGLKPSHAQLAEILKQHSAWLKAGGPFDSRLENDPRRANLCEASLTSADLTGANPTGARLSDATLIGANLNGVSLVDADLTSAGLLDATLVDADLS